MLSILFTSDLLPIITTEFSVRSSDNGTYRCFYNFIDPHNSFGLEYIVDAKYQDITGVYVEWLDINLEKTFYCDISVGDFLHNCFNIQSIDDSWKVWIKYSKSGLLYMLFGNSVKTIICDGYYGQNKEYNLELPYPPRPIISYSNFCRAQKYDISMELMARAVKYMQQFVYRYFPMLEKWDGDKWEPYKEEDPLRPQLDWCEESLYDGTYDKLHDGRLMNYHEAGKPKRLAVKWHVGKCEYSAYFWFDEVKICEIFDRFYGIHRDTKSDFIIRIDGEAKKYELALFRYGLKVPQVIPATAYQMIVFKNKFEDYRSENYDQPHGAWIW